MLGTDLVKAQIVDCADAHLPVRTGAQKSDQGETSGKTSARFEGGGSPVAQPIDLLHATFSDFSPTLARAENEGVRKKKQGILPRHNPVFDNTEY